MSATIHYRKTSTADPYLHTVGSPSSFIASLDRAFGAFPCELGPENVPVLKGMAATYNGSENPYEEVIELIEKFGSIELYAGY